MAETPRCIYCEQTDDRAPLVAFRFKGQDHWICSEHLPILIHQPALLATRLPGADKLEPASHDH